MEDTYIYPDAARLEVEPLVPSGPTSLLDIGCGKGGFLRTMRSARPRARLVGIELNPGAAASAAQVAHRVVVGAVPDCYDQLDEQFDCITFLDVLEHLVDPWQALASAAPLLRPGGRVIVSVPNVRCALVSARLLLRGQWNYTDDGILDRTHLRFFTRSSAVELVQRAGFVPLEVLPLTWVETDAPVKGSVWRAAHRLAPELSTVQYGVVAALP